MNTRTFGLKCWKCGRPIRNDLEGWGDDGKVYPTAPPQYAHERCPLPGEADPKPCIRLIVRHCRTCDLLQLMRGNPLAPPGGVQSGDLMYSSAGTDEHEVPGTKSPCPNPDFGPTVVVAEVPW